MDEEKRWWSWVEGIEEEEKEGLCLWLEMEEAMNSPLRERERRVCWCVRHCMFILSCVCGA